MAILTWPRYMSMIIALNDTIDVQYQRFEVEVGEILKLKFGQYFAADVWLRL